MSHSTLFECTFQRNEAAASVNLFLRNIHSKGNVIVSHGLSMLVVKFPSLHVHAYCFVYVDAYLFALLLS